MFTHAPTAWLLLLLLQFSPSTPTLPFQTMPGTTTILNTLSGTPTTPVFRLPWSFDLARLHTDLAAATLDWDWNSKEAKGHSMPLLSASQVPLTVGFPLPFHVPTPVEGFLQECCPYFFSIFEFFNEKTQVVSMRLLKRSPLTAYVLHSDNDLDAAGNNVKRFQIPILNQDLSGLLLTSLHGSILPIVAARGEKYNETNPLLNAMEHYPAKGRHKIPQWYGKNYTNELLKLTRHVNDFVELGAAYRLTTGYMHHFDTRTLHTIVNLSPHDRITLAIDVVVNEALQSPDIATGQIFAAAVQASELERQNRVMVQAAEQLYARNQGHLGTIALDTPTSGARYDTHAIDVEMSVSFANVEEYDAYKILCGTTVNAPTKQLVAGNCRVEIIVGDDIVAVRNRIETIAMVGVKPGEWKIQTRVLNQRNQILMASDTVVFYKV